MKLRTLKIHFLLCLCMAMGSHLFAQYGSGVDGSLFVTSTTYTDNVSSRVTNYSNSATGSGPYVNILTITTDVDISSSFSTGDILFVVDMEQSGRNYDGAEFVSAVPQGTGGCVITATCWRNDAPTPNVATGTKTNTQVFRVPQWTNVTLNSGILTCHAWDPVSGTGGILAFYCKGTLTFNGGTINTVGKGQSGYLGQPGGAAATAISSSLRGFANAAGGDGGSASGGTAYPSFTHKGGISPRVTNMGGASCTITAGGHGGCGGNSLDGAEVAPHNHIFSQASFSTLTMNFGRGGAEGRSGQGPGAGGHGGAGGGSGSSNLGTNGSLGVAPPPGSYGGDGGDGGIGGGMVYIKAYRVDATGQSGFLINTSGLNGNMGTSAVGDGGDGGAGGIGANGSCGGPNFYAPGGGGGHGTPGNGGDGGNGGNGGDGGEVWFLYNSLSNFTVSNIKADGGNGGAGGTLGTKHGRWAYGPGPSYSYQWKISPVEITPPLSNGTAANGCAGGGCPCVGGSSVLYAERVVRHDVQCEAVVCYDCSEAMWLLSIMTKREILGTGVYKYSEPDPLLASALGVSLSSYCMKTPNGFYAWKIDVNIGGTCSTPGLGEFQQPTYYCDFSTGLNSDWALIASTGIATTRSYGSYIEWTIGSQTVGFDMTTNSLIGANPGDNETACSPGGGSSGTPGLPSAAERPRNGHDGSPGVGGASGGVQLAATPPSSGNPWKKETGFEEVYANAITLELMPNPANGFLQFKTNSTQANGSQFQVRIYDLSGKALLERSFYGTDDKNTFDLDVSQLATGTYIFSVTQGGLKQETKLIIER